MDESFCSAFLFVAGELRSLLKALRAQSLPKALHAERPSQGERMNERASERVHGAAEEWNEKSGNECFHVSMYVNSSRNSSPSHSIHGAIEPRPHRNDSEREP